MIDNEEKILAAARKVFIEKGFDGTRMQEIADEAGINKSLLHYYYRSKDKLFEFVFTSAFKGLFPIIAEMFMSNESLFDKIRSFTSKYMTLLQENPHIPMFVLHELSRNPQRLIQMVDGLARIKENNVVERMSALVKSEVDKGTINPIDVRQLMVNVVSLSIFPFIAKPILTNIFLGNDSDAFNSFIEQRKVEVAEFIINSIKK